MTDRILVRTGQRAGAPALAVRLDRPEETAEPGLTILYLHGFGSSQGGEKAAFFRRKALAAGCSFCSFDHQGHGESEGDMLGLTLSRNLDDLGRVYEELAGRDLRRVALLGSSMGGLTGLWYAALHPEQVEAGLHLAPALGLERTFGRWLGDEGIQRWRTEGRARITNELGSWDLGWEFVEDMEHHPESRLAELCRVPTLLLQGALDDRVCWQAVAELAGAAAGAAVELHLFAEGDHRLLDFKPRLWELMLEFLRSRRILSQGPDNALEAQAPAPQASEASSASTRPE